jgi:FAD-linked sulfhydryl oxidase
LLHSIASQYPDEPTEREKRDAKNLINAVAALYPCKECQTHFQTVIKRYPPEVGDSVSFQEWMCKVHNVVNEKLGKEIFDCAKVEERWGGVECYGEDGSSSGGCSFENAPGRRGRHKAA